MKRPPSHLVLLLGLLGLLGLLDCDLAPDVPYYARCVGGTACAGGLVCDDRIGRCVNAPGASEGEGEGMPFLFVVDGVATDELEPNGTFDVVCDATLDVTTSPPTVAPPECIVGPVDRSFRDDVDGSLLVVVNGLRVGATLTTVGPLPVTFVVFGDAVVGGGIVARAGEAEAQECGLAAGGTGESSRLDGGANPLGAGGGGIAAGGDGGQSLKPGGGTGGFGGEIRGVGSERAGGCAGGAGGAVDETASGIGGGAGGAGGGSVQLAVAGVLSISGFVASPGSGGGSTVVWPGGGGGGGSGGRVVVEAGELVLEGAITANGGGGGRGGGGGGSDVPGQYGALDSARPAAGAGVVGEEGTGGVGGAGATPAGSPGENDGDGDGAGGGGGAAGIVRLRGVRCGVAPTAVVSPLAPCTQPRALD